MVARKRSLQQTLKLKRLRTASLRRQAKEAAVTTTTDLPSDDCLAIAKDVTTKNLPFEEDTSLPSIAAPEVSYISFPVIRSDLCEDAPFAFVDIAGRFSRTLEQKEWRKRKMKMEPEPEVKQDVRKSVSEKEAAKGDEERVKVELGDGTPGDAQGKNQKAALRKRRRKRNASGSEDIRRGTHINDRADSPQPKLERTSRVKRARVMFDPSDFNDLSRKRSKTDPPRTVASSDAKRKSTGQRHSGNHHNNKATATAVQEALGWVLRADDPSESESERSDLSTPQKDNKHPSRDKNNPGLCNKCGSNKINARDEMEELMICTSCAIAAHPSCMSLTGMAARKALLTPWLCIDCENEVCSECMKKDFPECEPYNPCWSWRQTCTDDWESTSFEQQPLFEGTKETCPNCESNYHKDCLAKRSLAENKEVNCIKCHKCIMSHPVAKEETPQPRPKPVEPSQKTQQSIIDKIPPRFLVLPPGLSYYGVGTRKEMSAPKKMIDVPDPTDWSPREVSHYFADVGFESVARTFEEEEIDGEALLLMNRLDLLTRMGIKLGVAAKMFQHVINMQYKFQQE